MRGDIDDSLPVELCISQLEDLIWRRLP